MKRLALLFLACLVIAGCRKASVRRSPDLAHDERPNIVLILADDLRPDVLGVGGHPVIRTPAIDRLADEGAFFENSFVVTPQCGPSRAALLTGSHGHINGVHENSSFHRMVGPTFAELLHNAGYATAFVGKWHIGDSDAPRPGFDHWAAFRGQGAYFDVELNVDGVVERTSGYSTDVLTDRAVDWIAAGPPEPFLLILSYKSVHMPLEPPARHAELFAGVSVSLPESYDDPADSLPAMIRDRFEERLAQKDTEPARDRLRDRIRKYWRMVPSIDESVGRVREALLDARAVDRTAIFFTSDNGILLGEHGLTLKGRGFDPALRVPLIVRYPPLAQPGTRLEASVLNIDLAPTILELAGLASPDTVQGRSLVPLLDGSATELRSSWLYVHPYKDSPNSVGARTDSWKYLLHRRGVPEEQLIDLVHDPGERTNLAGDPEYAERLAELRDGLHQLLELNDAPAEWADPAP